MADEWLLNDEILEAGHQKWREFRERWPIERLEAMTLEEYTNLEKDSAFIYQLEAQLDELGSIWGSSAFKFGIYRRKDTEPREAVRFKYGPEYAWGLKYGATEQEAFETVRAHVVAIARAAADGDFEAIDRIELFALVRWKIAFIYQDPDAWVLFPIYSNKVLLDLYRRFVDPAAKNSTPYSLRYETLRDRHRQFDDAIVLGHHLWQLRSDTDAACWALNLTGLGVDVKSGTVSSGSLPGEVQTWFSDDAVELEAGHRIALLSGDRVVGRAMVTAVDDADVTWKQEPIDLPSPFLPKAGLTIIADKSHQAAIFNETKAPAPLQTTTAPPPDPTNTILFGPPGTGKTYATVTRALTLILGPEATANMSRETAVKQFRQLQQEGRIELVTFHQAYGYEEFVEGLRPVLGDASGDVRYEIHPGVFKRIALRAAATGLRAKAEEPVFDTLWQVLVDRVREDEDRILQSSSGNEYVLRVNKRENFESYALERSAEDDEPVVTERKQIASRNLCRAWWGHRADLGGPEGITYDRAKEVVRREQGGDGGHHFTAIWLVYRELRQLAAELREKRVAAAPTNAQVQEALDRATPGKLDFQFTGDTARYVLVIDEINRGNISRILGELITLLEPDKRLSMPNELKVPLTYSPTHRFAVPPNLHVVGTMNTADRSIALMDVALRRRFAFEEVMPSAEPLREVLSKESNDDAFIALVVEIFETLNARIRFLYDRDHQLGHAYFMSATTYEELRSVLVDRVVPLLQEYFYGSWDKITAVLGCPYDEDGKPRRAGPVTAKGAYVAPIIEAKLLSERASLGFSADLFDDYVDHQVNEVVLEKSAPDELLPFLLGILELAPEDREARAAALRTGAAFS